MALEFLLLFIAGMAVIAAVGWVYEWMFDE